MTREKAWKVLTAARGTALWLGAGAPKRLVPGESYELEDGSTGEVRVLSDSHLRITWQPRGWDRPSTIQVRVIPNGDRTTIAFHQEHLPGPAEREERKTFFLEVLETLGGILASKRS